MDQNLVASRLNYYANWYAASKGFRFGDGSSSAISAMADRAASTIVGEPAPRAEASTRVAEAQLSAFIDAMIEHWRSQPALMSRGHIIGEETFGWATSTLCPLYPIC